MYLGRKYSIWHCFIMPCMLNMFECLCVRKVPACPVFESVLYWHGLFRSSLGSDCVANSPLCQDCYRVLVSLISWPGQLLSLFPCQRLKFLARMLFLGILSLTVVKCRKEEGKDKDEIVLLKQNEISSLIMEAATLKKYIWSCFGQTAPAGCE